jgi:hypothetical protein
MLRAADQGEGRVFRAINKAGRIWGPRPPSGTAARTCGAGRAARAPYAGTLARGAPGANTARSAPGVVGDLRYDRSPGLDFSDLPLDRAAPCPKRVPPWIPPRSDLFGPLE